MQKAPADTQFFCSNSSGSLTVTITMRELPPGKYAVVLADAAGAPLAGQIAEVLAWDAAARPEGWKLAGLTVRQGAIDGHDGTWYWARARELAKAGQAWSAWYCYEMARTLLIPVDFLSSPNLDKLSQEQGLVKLSSTGTSAQDLFPYSIQDPERTWKIDAIQVDLSLRQADLGVTYDSVGITDPAAQRTEAVAAMGAADELPRDVGLCDARRQADTGDGAADGEDSLEAGSREQGPGGWVGILRREGGRENANFLRTAARLPDWVALLLDRPTL
jgi:hypothetical protein